MTLTAGSGPKSWSSQRSFWQALSSQIWCAPSLEACDKIRNVLESVQRKAICCHFSSVKITLFSSSEVIVGQVFHHACWSSVLLETIKDRGTWSLRTGSVSENACSKRYSSCPFVKCVLRKRDEVLIAVSFVRIPCCYSFHDDPVDFKRLWVVARAGIL